MDIRENQIVSLVWHDGMQDVLDELTRRIAYTNSPKQSSEALVAHAILTCTKEARGVATFANVVDAVSVRFDEYVESDRDEWLSLIPSLISRIRRGELVVSDL